MHTTPRGATLLHVGFMTWALLVAGATAIADSGMQRPKAPKRGQTLEVSVTAYCIEGETKSGVQTRRGIVAADPAVLPLGTVIRISGLKRHNGRYTVQDTGRAIKGNDVDIFMPDCKAAKTFGRQQGRARVLRIGKPTGSGVARDERRSPGA